MKNLTDRQKVLLGIVDEQIAELSEIELQEAFGGSNPYGGDGGTSDPGSGGGGGSPAPDPAVCSAADIDDYLISRIYN
ncbi:MAG: hypothetical protein AAGB12_10260 [Pseudomonadota bacterium]